VKERQNAGGRCMMLRRRDLIGVTWIATASPPPAFAQQRASRVGLLLAAPVADEISAFRDELQSLGYVEGLNLLLDVRRSEAPEQNAALAEQLVASRPDILVAAGGQPVQALMRVAGSTPIVFTWVSDPVGNGIVASLARPGGSVTGIANYNPELNAKRVQLIGEAVPGAKRVGVLFAGASPFAKSVLPETERAALAYKVEIVSAPVRSIEDLERALTDTVNEKIDVLLVTADQLFSSKFDFIINFATAQRLPTIFFLPRHARAGGLMSYGVDPADNYRRAAALVDKILRGAKSADLPVENPTRLTLVINLRTARALGLTIPATVLARADEVIE